MRKNIPSPPPLKVLDLTHHVAGPYCTKLFAGFGADVIKVERPVTGDGMRSVGPFVHSREHREMSIPFLWLNTGKRSLTLDLKNEEGRRILLRLVEWADVVVENFSPGVMTRLKLGYQTLIKVNPAVIMTSISNFGQTGPYRDYKADEIVAYALSGLMRLTGDPARPPLRAGPMIAQYTAGMLAYIATLIALYQRELTGVGQHIDVSIQEAALDNIEVSVMEYLRLGKVANRTADEHALVPWQLFPCRDGHVAIIGGPIRHWLTGACLFNEPRLLEEPYRHAAGRIAHRDEVKALIQPWLERNAKKDIYHLGQRSRLAFGYLATLDEVYASPQLRARHFWAETVHPVAGSQQYCGPPFRPSDTPWRHGRAPLLGEHNNEILGEELGYSADQVSRHLPKGRRRVTDEAAGLPLAGLLILDLTHDWAGPHASRILADFGADVIKIEYARRMDGMRGARKEGQAYNHHPRWLEINRNKRSVTLDLKTDLGRDRFIELVRLADVVVASSRPDVLPRLGLGYEKLREIKPDIVYVCMSAFGDGGPESSYAGYGGCLEPLSGIQSLTGYGDGTPPMRIREVDVVNGVLGACAIMTALVHRQHTGRGQSVDLSQLEAAISGLVGEQFLAYTATGTLPQPMGNRHPWRAPQGCYRCAGEDRWVVLSVGTDAEWQGLCRALGRQELLDDPRFTTGRDRLRHSDALDLLIEEWTISRIPQAAMLSLQEAGVPAGAVQNVEDLRRDPQLAARRFFQTATDNDAGMFPGMPFRLSKVEAQVRCRGPHLGEHNVQVLSDLLGHPREEIPLLSLEELGTAYDIE